MRFIGALSCTLCYFIQVRKRVLGATLVFTTRDKWPALSGGTHFRHEMGLRKRKRPLLKYYNYTSRDGAYNAPIFYPDETIKWNVTKGNRKQRKPVQSTDGRPTATPRMHAWVSPVNQRRLARTTGAKKKKEK